MDLLFCLQRTAVWVLRACRHRWLRGRAGAAGRAGVQAPLAARAVQSALAGGREASYVVHWCELCT